MSVELLAEGVSTYPSACPIGEQIERTYDCVIATKTLQGKIWNMEVVKDFESRMHKAVTFQVDRDKDLQEVRVVNLSETLSGFRGGQMPGASKVAGGEEEGQEEDEVRQVDKDVRSAVLTADLVNSTVGGNLAGTVEKTCGVERSSRCLWAGEHFQHAQGE